MCPLKTCCAKTVFKRSLKMFQPRRPEWLDRNDGFNLVTCACTQGPPTRATCRVRNEHGVSYQIEQRRRYLLNMPLGSG
ncbi:hypothetical protein D3C78_1673180 [compost metagenome]